MFVLFSFVVGLLSGKKLILLSNSKNTAIGSSIGSIPRVCSNANSGYATMFAFVVVEFHCSKVDCGFFFIQVDLP